MYYFYFFINRRIIVDLCGDRMGLDGMALESLLSMKFDLVLLWHTTRNCSWILKSAEIICLQLLRGMPLGHPTFRSFSVYRVPRPGRYF